MAGLPSLGSAHTFHRLPQGEMPKIGYVVAYGHAAPNASSSSIRSSTFTEPSPLMSDGPPAVPKSSRRSIRSSTLTAPSLLMSAGQTAAARLPTNESPSPSQGPQ